MTFPPSIYGKINTFVQIILVFLVLISALTPIPWLKLVRHIFIDLCGFLHCLFRLALQHCGGAAIESIARGAIVCYSRTIPRPV